MRICPFCGCKLSDETYAELVSKKNAAAGRVRSDRKKAAGAKNLSKAREAITPERRAEILAKAREAKAAKKAAEKADEQ